MLKNLVNFLVKKSLESKRPRILKGHSYVWRVGFSQDGNLLWSLGDNWLKLWEFPALTEIRSLRQTDSGAAISNDVAMAAGGLGVCPVLWDLKTGEQRALPSPSPSLAKGFGAIAFSSSGRLLAWGTDLWTYVWDMDEQQWLPSQIDWKAGRWIVFSPDESMLIMPDNSPGHCDLRVWDSSALRIKDPNRRFVKSIRKLRGGTDQIHSVAFSTDGSRLAAAVDNKTIKLWELSTGTEVDSIPVEHPGQIRDVAFSPDGAVIASCSDWEIIITDTTTKSEVERLEWRCVHSIAFSPDGGTLAFGSGDTRKVNPNPGGLGIWSLTKTVNA
jgi:WD40 repeat protein